MHGRTQNNYQERYQLESIIQAMGALEAYNIASIVDTITSSFADKRDKALAIYYWIANNISLDPKSVKSNDKKKIDPVSVIQLRKTNSFGFALLFQEMCSMSNIRCLSINGYTKYNFKDIDNAPDEPNHYWNVVQIGQSPEEWFYVDVAKASGNLDSKFTNFTKSYSAGYFFAERKIFNLDHFPKNLSWLLGNGPRNKKDFYTLPLIESGAYLIGATNPFPLQGFIKTKPSNAVEFSFKKQSGTSINKMSIILKEGNKPEKREPLIYDEIDGSFKFRYSFKREETYVVKISADENALFTYIVESSE